MTDSDQRITISIERVDRPASLAGKHRLSFYLTDQHAVSVHLTQGELINLWQEIGTYFNLAGMREAGERHGGRYHSHRYRGQALRHSHEGGEVPHGYFGHPEDYPPVPPEPGEFYNGKPLTEEAQS
jgi:hypothetical protein